jgi:ABC-type Na+ efflux pump permease subunit
VSDPVKPEPRNPYEPPAAAVKDVEERTGSPVKAVLYGVLVDIGGSIVAGVAFVFLYSIGLAASGASAEDVQNAISDPSPMSWFSIIGFLIGCAASFLGGYVCARVAVTAEMKWVSIVAAVSGVVSILMGMGSLAFEWNGVLALVGMGAVFGGGWTGAKRNRRRA